jgi:hypothetical protein
MKLIAIFLSMMYLSFDFGWVCEGCAEKDERCRFNGWNVKAFYLSL